MGRIIRIVLYLVRIVSPVVARMAVAIFRMMVLALVTVLISLPRAVDFFASEWTQQAIDKGWIPTRWERVTYYILCAVAFIQFLVGFVVLSHITVWLFWLIF